MHSMVAMVMDDRLIDLLTRWRESGPVADPSRWFSPHADHLLVIEADPAGNRYSHYGRAFVRHFGADLTGLVVESLPAEILPADRRGMLDFDYDQARRLGRPLWRSYTAEFDHGRETWQRLVLPTGGGRLVVGAYPVAGGPSPDDPGAALLRLVIDRVPVILDENGAVMDLALSLQAYCDSQIHLAELEQRATHDSLTGIANRAHFHDVAGRELDHARRIRRAFAVLVLDLDHFKRINDRWGHAAGDAALRAFVVACRMVLRDGDILGRIGGEEFAVALPGTGTDSARMIAERLRRQVAGVRPCADLGDETGLTVSIGAAVWIGTEPEAPEIATLLAQADSALYRAKAGGRNRVEMAEPRG